MSFESPVAVVSQRYNNPFSFRTPRLTMMAAPSRFGVNRNGGGPISSNVDPIVTVTNGSPPKRPVRVCIIGSRGFPIVYSGYETLVAKIAPGLVQHGFHVTVYCHRHLFAMRPEQVQGVRLVYVPGLRGKSIAQYSHSTLSTLHALRDRVDVAIVLNVANGMFIPLLESVGIPTVVNVDGVEWARPKWKGLGASVFRAAAKLAARKASIIVTDADAMQARYRAEFDRDSVVIPYGADIRTVDESLVMQVLDRYGLARNEYLIILGRLIPDNNGELLVRAYLDSGIPEKLVVIGDVPYKDNYAGRLKALGGSKVLFTGYINEEDVLRALIGNARLYLHGHEFGGTNPSLLLAMSTGVPIAALDTEFSREVLPNTQGVWFFDKDRRQATDVIQSAAARQDIGKVRALQRRIGERYQWPAVVNAYASVTRRAAGRDDAHSSC